MLAYQFDFSSTIGGHGDRSSHTYVLLEDAELVVAVAGNQHAVDARVPEELPALLVVGVHHAVLHPAYILLLPDHSSFTFKISPLHFLEEMEKVMA